MSVTHVLDGIKGSLGEALVAELFRKNHWIVRRFGIEHHVPLLHGQSAGGNGSAGMFSAMPDLLVAKPLPSGAPPSEDARALFVEVKTGLEPTFEDATAYLGYGTVLIVHVAQTGIQAAWYFGERHATQTLKFQPIEHWWRLAMTGVEPFHATARHLHAAIARMKHDPESAPLVPALSNGAPPRSAVLAHARTCVTGGSGRKVRSALRALAIDEVRIAARPSAGA